MGVNRIAAGRVTLTASPRFRRAVDLIGQFGAPALIVIVLAVAIVVTPAFYAGDNLRSVATQSSILGIVAIGQTLVLLVSGLDMSVSAVLALGVFMVLGAGSRPLALSLLGAAAAALLIGLANGLLITKRRVPPFIATFGMLVFIQGVQLYTTHGQVSGTVPSWMQTLGVGTIAGIPWAAILWIVLTLFGVAFLRFTPYGRWIRAVGANRSAAHYAGVPVDRVTIACYMASALLALVSGIILSGYIGYVDQNIGTDSNLQSIAASIVGGTTFTGGRGSLFGTAAGSILLNILINLVIVAGLSISWQYAVEGAVLVVAVAVQGLRTSLQTT